MSHLPSPFPKRGASSNPGSRYLATQHTREHAQEDPDEAGDRSPRTTVIVEHAKTLIRYNQSPDVPFDRSINFAQGCEHGCIYCYARPSHAYWGLSPGLDFESKLIVKADAPALLRRELAKPGYCPAPLALGANTDPYQPIERHWRLTREILSILLECRHPVVITTKGALLERDLDLLAQLAEQRLVHVYISLTTLQGDLARRLEPRAATPARRLALLRQLREAGVPCGVLTAPVIPALTDHEVEQLLEAAHEAGARNAGYVLLRVPHEVENLFSEWLHAHVPQRAAHVLSALSEYRAGRVQDGRFGARMCGQGVLADLLAQRFRLACRKLGLSQHSAPLDSTAFRPPQQVPPASEVRQQRDLFDIA